MGIEKLENAAAEKRAGAILDLDEIIREAKAPREYDKRVLAVADQIVSDLSPSERRTVLVLALADRVVAWFDKRAEAVSKELKDYFSGATPHQDLFDYTEAIRQNPNYAGAYYSRGVDYAEKGELDKAIADFNEAIRLNPDFAKAYNDRGLAYKQKGDGDKADADFAKAKRLGYRPR